MRRVTSLLVLPLILLSLAACETTTDLESVSMEGKWDSVGSLNEIAPGLSLFLQAGPDGTFSGTWAQAGTSSSVTNGSSQNGVVTFTLVGFQGGTRTFEGRLTDAFRMEGSLDLAQLEAAAVFRRSSFSVSP